MSLSRRSLEEMRKRCMVRVMFSRWLLPHTQPFESAEDRKRLFSARHSCGAVDIIQMLAATIQLSRKNTGKKLTFVILDKVLSLKVVVFSGLHTFLLPSQLSVDRQQLGSAATVLRSHPHSGRPNRGRAHQ